MQLRELQLFTFRNYDNQTFDFQDNNLIVGYNGTGKTSILEAIDILASTKSKLVKGINKCIKKGFKGFIIQASLVKDNGEDVEIIFRQEKRNPRVVKINDEVIEKSSQLLGVVNSVILLPHDIDIIQGSPQERRKYFDIVISQIEQNYFETLKKYNQVLKQRNLILKEIKQHRQQPEALDIWDQQLAQLMGDIYLKRREYVDIFSGYVDNLYEKIGFTNKIELKYKTEVCGDVDKNLNGLKSKCSSDIITGHTSFGIHRDDVSFLIDQTDVAEFCSQGQQRLLVVCLKLSEATIKKEKLNDTPILLIDDVLLELDLKRFNNLIRETLDESQKLYTVTDTTRFDQELLKKMNLIRVGKMAEVQHV